MRRLRDFNGAPAIFFRERELQELLLPVLRADFAIWETYQFSNEAPLTCPITAFVGAQDQEVSTDDMVAWCIHTSNTFDLHVFPGDHFYWQSAPDPLLRTIAGLLTD
jgi:medium-chain acyl-[acyl-carrier-protein] hydrolase